MIQSVLSHLHFDGRADEAIALYQHALGATVDACMRWSEMPGGGCPAGEAGKVMHARLSLGKGALLLADVPKHAPHPARPNGTLLLDFDDAEELQRCFAALAEGGRVLMAVHDAFWGAKFGLLEDKLGVAWMLTCPNPAG